jgi:hypothetical protein
MKSFCLIVLLTLSATAFGKIWIVDTNPGSTAKDFTNLQTAHDGAVAGDTLYLIGSPISYITTKVTITKRLVIIGPGYFLNENVDTQANILPAFIQSTTPGVCEELEFASGSDGSVLMGIRILGFLVINANNILIKRNEFKHDYRCEKSTVIVNGSNVLISQNFMEGSPGGSSAIIAVTAGKSGILIGNNYLYHACANCGGGITALLSAPTSSVIVTNNIFYGGINVHNATVENNLFRTTNILSFTASVVRNNSATAGAVLPAGNNNESNLSGFNAAFVGSGSTDGRWQLTATSIFKGTGTGGSDRGMFGGIEPYVLSGIPPIPTIYSVIAPAVGEKNTGLPIQLKVKSNN